MFALLQVYSLKHMRFLMDVLNRVLFISPLLLSCFKKKIVSRKTGLK